MSKLSIGKILEASKLLETPSGKELADLINYLQQFAEQTVRALRNKLTFADNFDCVVQQVSIRPGVDLTINTDNRKPTGIIPLRVTQQGVSLHSFGWNLDSAGKTVCRASYFQTYSGSYTNPSTNIVAITAAGLTATDFPATKQIEVLQATDTDLVGTWPSVGTQLGFDKMVAVSPRVGTIRIAKPIVEAKNVLLLVLF